MKCAIVEDESLAVLNLKQLISQVAPDLEVIAEYSSAREALEKLPGVHFDLLFLDIQFNDNFDAFELLKAWPLDHLQVIFVTSFDNYALKAFRFNAIDYITKPIDKKELAEAISKARNRVLQKKELEALFKTIQAFRNRQIAVRGLHETVFIPVQRILYIMAEKEYSTIYFLNEQKQPSEIISSKHLGFWEGELEEYPFLRIHKSYLVNVDQVQSYNTRNLKLSSGTLLDIARERRKEVQLKILAYKTFL